MKKYRVYQVDSFTREKFSGNPAGVVYHADGLTKRQMQQLARELNNSETAFIFTGKKPDYDVEVRYFTPTTEVPICGHATIAAHYVRAIEEKLSTSCWVQKTKAGILPIDIEKDETGDYTIVMTQGKPEITAPFAHELIVRIVEALGITLADLREDCPVAIASAGHSKVMVGIKERCLLDRLQPDLVKLSAISGEIGCNGYYVFTLHPEEKVLVHGRMFAPAIGIAEDPVTGNANGPLGAYLVHFGLCQELATADFFEFYIIQGEAMGRPGTMRVRVEKKGQLPTKIQIFGQAVIVFATEIEM